MAETQYFEDDAGIRIPVDLKDRLVSRTSVVPNTWNPNKMDSFMREKLRNAILKDGFVAPILVRPLPASRAGTDAEYEIIDGEHRWQMAGELGMTEVPIVNLGRVSDDDAKQITVKANALRGEFDSVRLAEMVSDLSKSVGMSALAEALPYTPERMQAMVDLLSVDTSALGDFGPKDKTKDEKAEDDKPAGDPFKTFSPEQMKFDCQCPRCGFQFNKDKE